MRFIRISTVLYILTAYGGEFCEEDRNGCSEIQCFEGVECLDVPAPGVGAMCGVCPEGYTGDGEKCFGKIFDYFVLSVNFSPFHNKLQILMSAKWTRVCVSRSATTLLEVMSANVKMGISLWQELTSVRVIWPYVN